MDFEKILHKAKKNEKKKTKEPVNCYRTTFSPPKKEERTKGLSANIQKFLAKKEEEERRKKQEDDKRREELVALRNQDGKARKRVQVMLKRTKSANKSVLNDAIDTVNTADTINGPKQCDEDDYGYESQEASKFYNKMMEKYNAVPVEKKTTSKPNNRATAKDLVNTKDRVRQALLRQGEDEHIPHKRRRRNKDDEDDNDNGHRSRSNSRERSEEREKIEKPKPKRPPMPPPLDFSSLLKIAEKKQYEPVLVEKKVVKVKEEPERLMTKKEKLEHERQKDREKKVSEYLKASSSKSRSDDSPRNINGTREHSIDTIKDSEKRRSKEEGKSNDKNRDKQRNQQPIERNSHSYSKSSGSRYTPESHHSSQSRSRSRSPLTSKDRLSNGHAARNKLNHKVSSPSADRLSSSSAKTKDDSRRTSISSNESKIPPTSLPKIPKIPRLNEVDRKITEKDRIKEKEKLRDLERAKEKEREKEKERLKEKEREKFREKEREREKEKEKERQRLKEKMDREKQKERERERERVLERQREANKERERSRERLKEREYEKERERRERERREKEFKENVSKKSSSSSDKLKPSEPKKTSKYDKLDLFGERDSVSPERPTLKTVKTSDNMKKTLPQVKTERIKVVEDTTRDLFDNPVTIVRKQVNDKNAEKSNPIKSSSSKPEEKPKLSSSSKAATSSKISNDKSRPSSSSERKRDAEERGNISDKRPKLEHNSKPQSSKDNFKKPLPPEPRKQFPPKDLQRKEFPPRDLQRKEFPPRDLKPKQFPPRDLKPKQFPPRDLKPRQFPPSDVRRGSSAANKKRFEYERSDSEDSSDEDEDEYDDDLDGFIDDGPTDNAEDISRYIKDIFGYDKSKYLDDDGDIEESSFAEQMREESRSARLGLIEDLEDMAMEQREKRRKALQRMKRGRR